MPPNDWEEPLPPYLYESSPAAIAAGGLFTLAGLTDDSSRAEKDASYAKNILTTLTTPEFLANEILVGKAF